MKKNWALAATFSFLAACSPEISWTEGPTGADGRALQTLTLRNVPGGARIWFQELFDNHEVVEGPVSEIHHFQGTAFWFDIPEGAGKEFTIQYKTRPLPRHSWAPEGFVLQVMGKAAQVLPVRYKFLERTGTPIDARWFAAGYQPGPTDIVPLPKRTYAPGNAPDQVKHTEGWYRLTFGPDGKVQVESEDESGAFFARTTLSKLPEETKNLVIEDWPDLGLRGFMLDVVRDFRSKEEVLKVLDIMASYKLNLLHFHLGDDEAWCLEIPQLPDLTAFSGHHEMPDWDLKEPKALKPTANGRFGNATFFTEQEYKEILQYAWERRIQVVPEFDAPGHSRAAIKAMQHYEGRTGDRSFRLQDPADTSRYWTPQDFTDDVLDPDLPGVYKFYSVVFDEVVRMHREAGVPLPGIHIGGDEVPQGCWAGRDRRRVKDTFTRGMLQLAQERNIKLAGWQEIVENIEPETLEALKKQLLFVNAWETRGENADLPARLANAGVPVLLSNVQNAYVDLAYSDDPTEIGLHWGGYVDERKCFALPVWNYEGLQNPENIVGAEALLWSENLRSFDNATYQMLPKALGVWERAWNATPDWAGEEAFQKDFDRFYSIVKKKEMPVWDAQGLNYKKR